MTGEAMRAVLLICCLALGLNVAEASLPEKILSGYCCAFLSPDGELVDAPRLIRLMNLLATNGFNSIDVKIQPTDGRSLDVDRSRAALAAAVAAAHARGLAFQVYLYTLPCLAERHPEWPDHAALPASFDETGRELPQAFRYSEPCVWQALFPHAAAFARARKDIGFDALKFDIERIEEHFHVSYDAENIRRFRTSHPEKSPRSDKSDYRAFFISRVASAVAAWLTTLRDSAPDLPLGYMPARPTGEFSEMFDRLLATASAPAVSDGWNLYNGEGYSPSVAAQAEFVRSRNSRARFVAWLRPDNYLPDDLAMSAYQTAAHADGYSFWSLDMLDRANAPIRRRHPLQGRDSPEEAWAAFAQANRALVADIAEGTLASADRIALRPVSRRVASLELSDVPFPNLSPVRPLASFRDMGPRLVLREQQTIFFYRRTGEEIRIELAHLAGRKRPCSLQYALLDAAQVKIRNESVSPGECATFRLAAPTTGLYALVVSGGAGGQAWYGVRVNGCWCVAARRGVSLFGPQTFAVPGRASGNPRLSLSMSDGEAYRCRVNGGPVVENAYRAKSEIPLVDAVDTLSFARHPATDYCQNFNIAFPGGQAPYVFPSAERAMKEVHDE